MKLHQVYKARLIGDQGCEDVAVFPFAFEAVRRGLGQEAESERTDSYHIVGSIVSANATNDSDFKRFSGYVMNIDGRQFTIEFVTAIAFIGTSIEPV